MTKHRHNSIALLENPTALSLAERHRGELKQLLISKGIIIFPDLFMARYWEDLPNEELTQDKIQAVINYLESE